MKKYKIILPTILEAILCLDILAYVKNLTET